LWGFRREGGADADADGDAEARTEVGMWAGQDGGDAVARRDERPGPKTPAAAAVEEEVGPVDKCFGARVSASNGVLVGPCHADEGVGGVSLIMK
jgi:hypothetical protein